MFFLKAPTKKRIGKTGEALTLCGRALSCFPNPLQVLSLLMAVRA